MKRTYFINIVILMLLASQAWAYRYQTSFDAELEQDGASNCLLVNGVTYTTNNRGIDETVAPEQIRFQPVAACEVQVLSSSQIIAPSGSACSLPSNSRLMRRRLICNEGNTIYHFKNFVSDSLNENGPFTILEIPERLDFTPPRINDSREERDALVERGQCYFESSFGIFQMRAPVTGQNFSIAGTNENPVAVQFANTPPFDARFDGVTLFCADESGSSKIVGTLDMDGKLHFIDQYAAFLAVNKKEDQPPVQIRVGRNQNVIGCEESGRCLMDLKETIELAEETLPILWTLQRQYEDLLKKGELSEEEGRYVLRASESSAEVAYGFREIMTWCQEAYTEFQSRSDAENGESNWDRYLLGPITGTLLSGANTVGWQDFESFVRSDPGVAELISEEDYRRIAENVENEFPDYNTTEASAEIARRVGRIVVEKTLTKQGLFQGDPEGKEAYLEDLLSDYYDCTRDVSNVVSLMTCSENFSVTAAASISKVSLDLELEKNFKERFGTGENFDEAAYLSLVEKSEAAYNKCIREYFYPNKEIELPTNDQRAKACVFEGILAGYNEVAEYELTKKFSEVESDPTKRAQMVADALTRAQQCHMGRLFASAGNLTRREHETLTRMDAEQFKTSLDSCVDQLQTVGGEVFIRTQLYATPEIQENFSEGPERDAVIAATIDNIYTPCVERLRASGAGVNAERCRPALEGLTTIEVAQSIIDDTLEIELGSNQPEVEPAVAERAQLAASRIRTEVDECQANLTEQYLETLNAEFGKPEARDVYECLAIGVSGVALEITPATIENTVTGDPLLAPYREQIMELDGIAEIPEQVALCIREEMAKGNNLSEANSVIDQAKEKCSFQAQKSATLLIAPLVIRAELAKQIDNPALADSVVTSYLEGNAGLLARLRTAETQADLDSALAPIQIDLTERVASNLVREQIFAQLGDLKSESEKEELANAILGELTQCLEEARGKPREEQDQATTICLNLTLKSSYENIAIAQIEATIHETLGANRPESEELVLKTGMAFIECTNKVDSTLARDEFEKEIQKCLTEQIVNTSRDVPRQVLLNYGPLLGSSVGEELEQQLSEVEKFYFEGAGDLRNVDNRDPAVLAYSALLTCLSSRNYEIQRSNNYDPEVVMPALAPCTDKFKTDVESSVQQAFIQGPYPGQRPEHEAALTEVAAIIIELQGKDEGGNEGSDDPDLKSVLDTLGTAVVDTCNYNPNCQQLIEKARTDFLVYKAQNPDASRQQLTKFFLETEFGQELMAAQLASMMRREFHTAMNDLKDEGGVLDRTIDQITSKEYIDRLMNGRYGSVMKNIIVDTIVYGNADDLPTNQNLRRLIAVGLTEDRGQGSFVDTLMTGLIQPELDRQKENSDDIGDFFTNTRTTLGRLFGIVEGENFVWERIRTTSSGNAATTLFADEILLPSIMGDPILSQQAPGSNEDDQKTVQDLRIERLQELVATGLQELE